MMNFAATTVSDNMSNRFNSAVPILGAHWTSLKYYFEVDNRYVLSKLRAIVFSALLKGKKWRREEMDDAPSGQDTYAKKYATPANDENAPDLYLPLMSFVTYIVVCSYIKGTNGKFTPEVLSQVMYFCLGWQLLEIVVIKCGLYTLQQQSPFLDLVANTGYKYVGLCINMLVGMLLGRTMYYVALLWTGTMTSYFMLKTLSNNYARQTSNGGMGKGMRMPLLWSFAVLQFLSIWVLGYGGEL
jgi:hypothetical protein